MFPKLNSIRRLHLWLIPQNLTIFRLRQASALALPVVENILAAQNFSVPAQKKIFLVCDFASNFLQKSENFSDFVRPKILLNCAWSDWSSDQSLSDLVEQACWTGNWIPTFASLTSAVSHGGTRIMLDTKVSTHAELQACVTLSTKVSAASLFDYHYWDSRKFLRSSPYSQLVLLGISSGLS